VNEAVVTASAVGVLIDTAIAGAGFASSSQLAATNTSVGELADLLPASYVGKPDDWNTWSSPDGLKSYVERKAVMHPSDWLAYPADPPYFGSKTLKVYTEGKVNNFKDGNSSYLKLRDASGDTQTATEQAHRKSSS